MGRFAEDLGKRALALVVLLIAAYVLFKVVIGFIAGVVWLIVIVMAVAGVLWAVQVLR